MGSDRASLLLKLQNYQSDFAHEMSFRQRFIALIENYENCFERSLLQGHITGSAWIVDETFSAAFMTHHAKLRRWLQPGGHADGDENVGRVALKEATEETGMQGLQLYSGEIFDLDIHTIPERKGVPEHEHYDIRYMISASRQTPYQISEESSALAWIPLEQLSEKTNQNQSILRMVDKTKSIHSKMSASAF